MRWLPPKKFVLGCLGSVLFTFLACGGLFVWWLNQTDYVSRDFCTTHDELYQTINAKAQDWLREFPKSLAPVIHFSTPSGRKYVVSGEALQSNDDSYIFVYVQQTHPSSPMGTRGYMYAISGKLPEFNPIVLKTTYLGEKIYCYEKLA